MVEHQDLVAAVDEVLDGREVLWLGASEARSALEVDHVWLWGSGLVRREYGGFALCGAAGKEADCAGGRVFVVERHLEPLLGDDELAGHDVRGAAEQRGGRDGELGWRGHCWCERDQ